MAGHPDYTTFVTSTIQKYRPKLIENLMGQNALFWQLKSRGFVTEDKGGRSIVQPLMYGTNSTVRSYDGWDLLDVTPQEGITAAEFDWKFFAGSVVMSGVEEFKNSGSKEAIFNLLEAKIRQLEISMKLEMNTQLYADGSGNGGKNLTGLAVAVEDGTAWATYGGIDGSDASNSWWRNQYFNFDTFHGGASTFGEAYQTKSTKGIGAMRNMFTRCMRNGTKPTLIITTSDIYNAYEGNIEGDKLRTNDTKLAEAGFINQTYKGVPMIFDEDMDSEGMLFLNSEYLKFVIGKGRNFTSTPFVKAPQQDGKHSFVLFAGNLVMSKRDVHGRITAITV